MLPVGARAVFSSLMTEMSSGSTCWVESHHVCCSSSCSPSLSGWAQVPSICLFFHPRQQWKNQSPVFGRRDAFLPGESQTISTTGPGIFTRGHIAREEQKGFLSGWENEEGRFLLLSLANFITTCKLNEGVSPGWTLS